MKNAIFWSLLLLAFFSCRKSHVIDEPPVDPPIIDTTPTTVDTFTLRGKVIYGWEYAHVYGFEYKFLPYGAKGRLPETVNYPCKWSNKGAKIAASSDWRLLILDAGTMDTLYFNGYMDNLNDFAWSPDDREIALIRYGSSKIRLLNLETQMSKYLTIPGGLLPYQLDWWAEGNQFSFVAMAPDGTFGLYLLSGDGTSLYTVLSGYKKSYELGNPRVAPNGKTIAFNGTEIDLSKTAIYLVDIETRQKREFWRSAGTPRWSADGKVIMATFVSEGTGKYGEDEVFIVAKEVNGTRLRNVTTSTYTSSLVDWWDK